MDVIARASRPSPRRRPRHRAGMGGRQLATLVELAVIVAVLLLCWPQRLGGSLAFVEVSGNSMLPTYRSGDLLVTRAQAEYHVGDVVVYVVPSGDVGAGTDVVHRIVGGDGRSGFRTRGDNNAYPDPWRPRATEVVGRVLLHVDGAGAWLEFLTRPVNIGILCGSTTITCMLWPRSTRRRRARRSEIPRPRSAGACPGADQGSARYEGIAAPLPSP